MPLEVFESRDDGGSALGVCVLDHDVSEDLGRVDVFEKLRTSNLFITGKPTIRALH